jgi:hypothetical protein
MRWGCAIELSTPVPGLAWRRFSFCQKGMVRIDPNATREQVASQRTGAQPSARMTPYLSVKDTTESIILEEPGKVNGHVGDSGIGHLANLPVDGAMWQSRPWTIASVSCIIQTGGVGLGQEERLQEQAAISGQEEESTGSCILRTGFSWRS